MDAISPGARHLNESKKTKLLEELEDVLAQCGALSVELPDNAEDLIEKALMIRDKCYGTTPAVRDDRITSYIQRWQREHISSGEEYSSTILWRLLVGGGSISSGIDKTGRLFDTPDGRVTSLVKDIYNSLL